MYIDIARAYQLALRWKVSQDTRYADLAVVFLNEWSSTLTTLTGNADRFLAAGIYGYQFANAAEIMRTYEGWAAADFARFQNMMLTVFYPLNQQLPDQPQRRPRSPTTGPTGTSAPWPRCWPSACCATGRTSTTRR